MSVRGVITSRAFFSLNSNTPSSRPRVAGAQAARFAALLDQHADLFGRMHTVELGVRAFDAEHPQQDARAPVE